MAARGCSAQAITSRQDEMPALTKAGRAQARVLLCAVATLVGACQTTWPTTRVKVARDAAIEARVREIVAGMTLEQKIGQMTQPDIRSVTPDEVRRYYIGSILNGGGAWPGMALLRG